MRNTEALNKTLPNLGRGQKVDGVAVGLHMVQRCMHTRT
jgi:hypothetical protein